MFFWIRSLYIKQQSIYYAPVWNNGINLYISISLFIVFGYSRSIFYVIKTNSQRGSLMQAKRCYSVAYKYNKTDINIARRGVNYITWKITPTHWGLIIQSLSRAWKRSVEPFITAMRIAEYHSRLIRRVACYP